MSEHRTVVFLTPLMPATSHNGPAMRAGLFLEGLARCGRVSTPSSTGPGGTARS